MEAPVPVVPPAEVGWREYGPAVTTRVVEPLEVSGREEAPVVGGITVVTPLTTLMPPIDLGSAARMEGPEAAGVVTAWYPSTTGR